MGKLGSDHIWFHKSAVILKAIIVVSVKEKDNSYNCEVEILGNGE